MIFCITNDMAHVTPCAVRGEHSTSCDGWERRATETELVPTGRDCRGCLPREATAGFLCWACFESARLAITESVSFMEAWAKYPRLVQQVSEGIKSSPDGFINLPSTALAVDELNRYLASFPGSTETWASSPEGAQDAVRFTRRFNAAKLAFPLVDIPSRLHEACPECELKTLLRTPPQKKFDRVTVTCQNPKCLHQLTEIEEEELI